MMGGEYGAEDARKLFEALCKGVDASKYDAPLQSFRFRCGMSMREIYTLVLDMCFRVTSLYSVATLCVVNLCHFHCLDSKTCSARGNLCSRVSTSLLMLTRLSRDSDYRY